MSDQKMPPMPAGMPSLEEVLLQSNDIPWREKSLAGISEKMLWRDEKGGSSIALISSTRARGFPSRICTRRTNSCSVSKDDTSIPRRA